MVEHVESLREGAATRARILALPTGRLIGWALDAALLFPVCALYVIALTTELPRELASDSWLVLFGGHEVVHHGLPSGPDTLTLWTHGRHWVDQQWLAQLAFYGLYALGGLKLALMLHVAAASTAFVLAIAAARWRGASVRSVCWVALPAIFLLIWSSWAVRAQTLALVLFVGVVWLLLHDARTPSRRVFLVFPLLVLWANIHGTAATGALLVVLYGLTYGFEHRRRPRREWLGRAIVLCIGPIACLFASPYAASLPGYYHRLLLNPAFRDHVAEWRPTTLDLRTAPFYLLAFITAWLAGRQRGRLGRYEQVLLVVTLLIGLQTLRGVLWFALSALMLAPVLLDGVLNRNMSAMRFSLLNRSLVAASVAGIFLAVVAVAAQPSSWFERAYPASVLAAVQRSEAKDPQVRVFANEQYADWLLLRRPELAGRVAYDARFELLSRGQLDKLVDIRQPIEGWQKVVAPYGLFILREGMDTNLARGLLRESGTHLEYHADGAIVIARVGRAVRSVSG
jgi:hypothetical protein